MKIGLDADVVIQLISKEADRHSATMAGLARHRDAGDEFILAENVLLEAFAVLSRAPKPTGIHPSEAVRALHDLFGQATTAPIPRGLALEAIRHTFDRGFAGGRVYDAAIALAAYEAGAQLLLTWNVKHFISVAPVGLEVRHP